MKLWKHLALAFSLALSAAAQPAWPPRSFTAYYGKIEAETPAQLAGFDLLIVHPGENGTNLDADKISRLRTTGKEKTLVGYISIGEDSRSPGGPPLQGQDSSGPTFVGKDLKQALAGSGYPAYFFDQRKQTLGPDGFPVRGPNGRTLEEKGQDGMPDENGVWGSYYVKAGHPAWQARVFEELDRLDKLGLDGFFLDTVDTASPWGDYGWTSSEMLDLIEKIRQRYPEKRIVANRGLFFLGGNDRYARLIDAVLFESLLTTYREESQSAEVSQWARWHVEALEKDVIPSQKRTGLTLLVLDYLNPEHKDAPLLIQSLRTLLKDTSHCLTFSRPMLDIPGWTDAELLTAAVPGEWPSVTALEPKEEGPGVLAVSITFDGPVPAGSLPDLRITNRTDLAPRLAAELPLAPISSSEIEGNRMIVRASGLNKSTPYQLFFRLVSASPAPTSPFAWTAFQSGPSELPGQATELSSEATLDGLLLRFSPPKADSPQAYRVYRADSTGTLTLWKEGPAPPIALPALEPGQLATLVVKAVDAQGREGYSSLPHTAVGRHLTPPDPPGPVTVSGNAESLTFRWNAVSDAKSYRLFAVPQGQSYRLPLVSKETELTVRGAQKGTYQIFATSVDKFGNQSRPGPRIEYTVK